MEEKVNDNAATSADTRNNIVKDNHSDVATKTNNSIGNGVETNQKPDEKGQLSEDCEPAKLEMTPLENASTAVDSDVDKISTSDVLAEKESTPVEPKDEPISPQPEEVPPTAESEKIPSPAQPEKTPSQTEPEKTPSQTEPDTPPSPAQPEKVPSPTEVKETPSPDEPKKTLSPTELEKVSSPVDPKETSPSSESKKMPSPDRPGKEPPKLDSNKSNKPQEVSALTTTTHQTTNNEMTTAATNNNTSTTSILSQTSMDAQIEKVIENNFVDLDTLPELSKSDLKHLSQDDQSNDPNISPLPHEKVPIEIKKAENVPKVAREVAKLKTETIAESKQTRRSSRRTRPEPQQDTKLDDDNRKPVFETSKRRRVALEDDQDNKDENDEKSADTSVIKDASIKRKSRVSRSSIAVNKAISAANITCIDKVTNRNYKMIPTNDQLFRCPECEFTSARFGNMVFHLKKSCPGIEAGFQKLVDQYKLSMQSPKKKRNSIKSRG